MKLQGISLNVVRNKYEYEKYVSASYREKYSYEESAPSLPWLIINFDKGNDADGSGKYALTMSPAADFTNIPAAPDGKWSVDEDDKSKLNLDLSKENFNALMLEVKKDCGFDALPIKLEVIAEDDLGVSFVDTYTGIDLSDSVAIMRDIDEKCIQQGEGYLARLVYELIAEKAAPTPSPTPESKVVEDANENEPEGN